MDDRRGALDAPAAPGTASGRDEAYAYDGLDRLVKAWRGTLSSDKTNPANVPYPGDATRDGTVDFLDYVRVTTNYGQTTSDWERGDMNGDGTVDYLDYVIVATHYGQSPTVSLTAAQEWSLEALGNWREYKEDAGDGSNWDLDQDRAHNKVNEIAGNSGNPISGSPNWIDPNYKNSVGDPLPGYDGAGNMLSGPKPGAESGGGAVRQWYVWDAWNRLVAVWEDDGDDKREFTGTPPDDTLVLTLRYDGLNRRIQKVVEGSPDVTYDYYYNESWQIVEVRKDGDLSEQYVWDQRYIDAPVVRWYDLNGDEDFDDANEMLYYTGDANYNVTALVAPDGTVVERYAYDPYGKVTVLDPDFSADANGESDFDNPILYCGYFLDWETGVYNVRRRPYHVTLGRLPSRDPGGYADGMSLYEYVASGPLGSSDPFGLQQSMGSDPSRPLPRLPFILDLSDDEVCKYFDNRAMTLDEELMNDPDCTLCGCTVTRNSEARDYRIGWRPMEDWRLLGEMGARSIGSGHWERKKEEAWQKAKRGKAELHYDCGIILWIFTDDEYRTYTFFFEAEEPYTKEDVQRVGTFANTIGQVQRPDYYQGFTPSFGSAWELENYN